MNPKLHLVACTLVATIGAAVSLPAWATDNASSTEQALMKLENDWCGALIKNDVSALSPILADDLTEVTPSGVTGNKASILSEAKSTKVSVCKSDQMKVSVYGSAAIVTGVTTYKDSSSGGEYLFTDTYVRRDGRWQCVATHETPIKK